MAINSPVAMLTHIGLFLALKMYLKDSDVYNSNNRYFYFDNIILLVICLQLKGYTDM